MKVNMRSVYCSIGLILAATASMVVLWIPCIELYAQQQPITEAIRQNSEVSVVTVAQENATSVSLISTKPAQLAQAVSIIEQQFHMHVVSKSIVPFPEMQYRVVMSKWAIELDQFMCHNGTFFKLISSLALRETWILSNQVCLHVVVWMENVTKSISNQDLVITHGKKNCLTK